MPAETLVRHVHRLANSENTLEVADLGHLIDDIDLLLATSGLPMTYPGRQTRPVLQTLEADHWQRLYAGMSPVEWWGFGERFGPPCGEPSA